LLRFKQQSAFSRTGQASCCVNDHVRRSYVVRNPSETVGKIGIRSARRRVRGNLHEIVTETGGFAPPIRRLQTLDWLTA
jgi:hypothetical protein